MTTLLSETFPTFSLFLFLRSYVREIDLFIRAQQRLMNNLFLDVFYKIHPWRKAFFLSYPVLGLALTEAIYHHRLCFGAHSYSDRALEGANLSFCPCLSWLNQGNFRLPESKSPFFFGGADSLAMKK